LIDCSFWTKASEFLTWYLNCPMSGLSRLARYFAKAYVGEPIRFPTGLNSTSFLWILGSLYSLDEAKVWGVSLLASSSEMFDFFIRAVVHLSILLVGSAVSFMYTGAPRTVLTLLW
jgi:hypothetical protein